MENAGSYCKDVAAWAKSVLGDVENTTIL